MPRGRAVSEDLRRVIVHMAATLLLDLETMRCLTNVPRRTIERILSTYRETGHVMPQDAHRRVRGRRRALNYDDLRVSELSYSW